MNVLQTIDELVSYAKERLELKERDEYYIKNRLLEIFGRIEGDTLTADEEDEVYGELSLLPSEVNQKFCDLCKQGTKEATDWFYAYCVSNRYVKRTELDKNPRFDSQGLVITINKAKPEFRDPKKAKTGNSVNAGYAKCVICRQNEGLGARSKRTLRTVDIKLGGENWFWQYSPYGYFNEHGIAVNCEHVPMHVDDGTFEKLMDFADMFPHYFIGCNAPLPRIGGSVLAHDHFQGGGEILPMHRAKALHVLKSECYPDAVAEIVDWRGTVVRIVSPSRASVSAICSAINKKWVSFNAPELGIIAEDEDGAHNAISPTLVKTPRGYEMSVILRSNITSAQYPDGVFHAHPEFHVVKKESIGLIEAQGLFILPGRLEAQLAEVEKFIERGEPLSPEYAEFELVYKEAAEIARKNNMGAHEAMKAELGSICNRILDNTAVFKDKNLLIKFMSELGFTE